jgi:alpha-beta hydrolase superfamily lysophospholipase
VKALIAFLTTADALNVSLTNAQTSEVARYPSVNYTDASPHKSAFARVNGVSLNYLDWGGDGPALVMMHGIGDDPHVFDDLASLLHDRFRIIAYARRGHGLSDAPPGPYDAATLAEDFRHRSTTCIRHERARLVDGWQ